MPRVFLVLLGKLLEHRLKVGGHRDRRLLCLRSLEGEQQ